MGEPLQFIHYAHGSRRDNALSAHIARSHTARVNRQKQAQRHRLESAGGFEGSNGAQPVKARPNRKQEFQDSILSCEGHTVIVQVLGDKDESAGEPTDGQLWSQPKVKYGLSPVFGGVLSSTFDVAKSSSRTAEVAHYVFNEVFSSCFTHDERSLWLAKFSQNSLVYHAFSYFRLFHQERVAYPLSLQQKQDMLDESLRVFRMLNDTLSHVEKKDVEPMLLSMTLMFKDRETSGKEHPSLNEPLLFSPHMLQKELAGLDIGRVRQTEGYLPAVSLITQRFGGLNALEDSGLTRIMCMSDLIDASLNFGSPHFPCAWHIDPSMLLPGKYWRASDGIDEPGKGFKSIPTGLPRVETFVTLSMVDVAMSQARDKRPEGNDFKHLVAARNVAKHKVLSLPIWKSLSEVEKCGAYEDLYECCRLTAILYANAVVFPTLEEFPGVTEPVRQLRKRIESCSASQWVDDISDVLLWCLFVAGIAAHRTQHWTFFVETLQGLTTHVMIFSLDTLKPILRQFVWSDCACDEGAAVLWDAIQRGRQN